MAYTEFALWLTPCEPLRTLLHSTISLLAARFDAVEFEPHVTVFCGPSTDAEARAIARQVARQFSPIELTAAGLNHTEHYTKALFVQFPGLPAYGGSSRPRPRTIPDHPIMS